MLVRELMYLVLDNPKDEALTLVAAVVVASAGAVVTASVEETCVFKVVCPVLVRGLMYLVGDDAVFEAAVLHLVNSVAEAVVLDPMVDDVSPVVLNVED